MALFEYLICFAASLGMSLALTPWMAGTARRIGLVDRPDGRLKRQEEAVPYLGGLAVFTAFIVGFAIVHTLDRQALAILLGATLVVLLGLLDDMGRLPPMTKMLGQSLAVLVVLRAGVAIQIVYLPPWVDYPLSFLWLLGITNAFNLVDIMDGLSSGLGAVACLFLIVFAHTAGQTDIALMTLALLGSLLGFLRFNFHPARIYLGDAGSLFVGFVLGAVTMVGQYARGNSVAVLAPVLILGVPIFDTAFVSIVRHMRGESPFLGSPDHFPLRLRRWRLSVRQTVVASCSVAAVLGLCSLVMAYGSQETAVAVLAGVSAALLAAALWLRRIDMSM